MTNEERIHIATIGRCVGLRGDLKLHLYTDFPEQFKAGAMFQTDKNERLTIDSYNSHSGLVRFEGFSDRTAASRLTNRKLYTTRSESRRACNLKEGEYFWFEITGATVEEGGEKLGTVREIERINATDYLIVETDAALQAEGLPKRFYIPWIPNYVIRFDPEAKVVYTTDARSILEAS